MDPSKVMYYDPRRYVKNFDPDMQSKAPRRGAVDLTAVNQVRTDHWHRGLPSQVVSRNHDQFPAITFCPSDGVGSGVALTECDFAQGIAAPAESIFTRLPASLQNITSGVFLITWPGYQHLKWRKRVTFVHPNGTPFTIAQMASQIAYLWRCFYDEYRNSFENIYGAGIRLGPSDITYSHLRLHEIWTNDGRHWQAEMSYVKTK